MGFYRRRSGLTAACGLLALASAAPAWSAEATDSKTVSIDVAAGDLHAVVSMLERQVNVEASVRDGDKPYKQVYVHLDGASLPKALRTIARSAGAKVTKNEDGVYVFEPESASGDVGGDVSDATARPMPAVQSPAAPLPVDNRPESRYPPGSLHWQSIVLQHAVPSDILKIMHWDQDMVEIIPFKPLEAPQQRPNVSSFGSNMILPSNLSGYGNNGYPNNGYGNGGYGNGGDPPVRIMLTPLTAAPNLAPRTRQTSSAAVSSAAASLAVVSSAAASLAAASLAVAVSLAAVVVSSAAASSAVAASSAKGTRSAARAVPEAGAAPADRDRPPCPMA